MRRTNLHAELLNGYFESRLVVILIHCVEEFHDIKFRQWDFLPIPSVLRQFNQNLIFWEKYGT